MASGIIPRDFLSKAEDVAEEVSINVCSLIYYTCFKRYVIEMYNLNSHQLPAQLVFNDLIYQFCRK